MPAYASRAQQRYMNLMNRRGLADPTQVTQMNLETKPLGGYDRLKQNANQGSTLTAPWRTRRKK